MSADVEQKIALLRIQLFTAAQTLKGEHLVAFAELIREIAMVLDVELLDKLLDVEPRSGDCDGARCRAAIGGRVRFPNPLPISCTTCHRAMRIEYQEAQEAQEAQSDDDVIVAAECACGRKFGFISVCALQAYTNDGRPLTAWDIRPDDQDLGRAAESGIERARARIAVYERRIAAATWARGGK